MLILCFVVLCYYVSYVLRLVSDVMLECNITAFGLHVVIVTHRGTALSGKDAGHLSRIYKTT